MKTVMIPDNASLWIAHINGKKYAYPGGTMQEVPDEVAALIRSQSAPEAEIRVEQPWVPHEVEGYVDNEDIKDYAKKADVMKKSSAITGWDGEKAQTLQHDDGGVTRWVDNASE